MKSNFSYKNTKKTEKKLSLPNVPSNKACWLFASSYTGSKNSGYAVIDSSMKIAVLFT